MRTIRSDQTKKKGVVIKGNDTDEGKRMKKSRQIDEGKRIEKSRQIATSHTNTHTHIYIYICAIDMTHGAILMFQTVGQPNT